MLGRVVSIFGFVAHIGDAITGPFKLARTRSKPVAGTARLPGSLIVGFALVLVAFSAIEAGNYATANKEPTTYTVEQLLFQSRNGRDYATITGQLYDSYVDESDNNGNYQYTYYLLGDPSAPGGGEWIVVRSSLAEASMARLASSNGTVTLTGMLTDDGSAVASVSRTLGTDTPSGLNPFVVLHQGDTPFPAEPLYALGAISGVVGPTLLLCWLATLAFGYVAFRRARSRQTMISAPGSGMIPVRVTGLIPGYRNGIRAREKRAELRVPQPDPAGATPPVDIVWASKKGIVNGARLAPGATRIEMGTALPVCGARPAVRVRLDRFDILISFDTEVARDAAFDQLRASAGLTVAPDGASASLPA